MKHFICVNLIFFAIHISWVLNEIVILPLNKHIPNMNISLILYLHQTNSSICELEMSVFKVWILFPLPASSGVPLTNGASTVIMYQQLISIQLRVLHTLTFSLLNFLAYHLFLEPTCPPYLHPLNTLAAWCQKNQTSCSKRLSVISNRLSPPLSLSSFLSTPRNRNRGFSHSFLSLILLKTFFHLSFTMIVRMRFLHSSEQYLHFFLVILLFSRFRTDAQCLKCHNTSQPSLIIPCRC